MKNAKSEARKPFGENVETKLKYCATISVRNLQLSVAIPSEMCQCPNLLLTTTLLLHSIWRQQRLLSNTTSNWTVCISCRFVTNIHFHSNAKLYKTTSSDGAN